MKTPRFIFLIISGILVLPQPASSEVGTVAKGLDDIARKLIHEFHRERPLANAQPLAILPFSTNEKLARERVGFAVSELMMRRFVKNKGFSVVEREKVSRILDEQRFQLSGAVDSKSAAKVGKLVGAKFLLLGSVQKLGEKYHITARMVEVESGMVVSVGFQEFSSHLFEIEAKDYLQLEGRKRNLAFYFFINYRTNPNNSSNQQTRHAGFSGTFCPSVPGACDGSLSPTGFQLVMIGGGFRYLPKEWLMLDMSYATNTNAFTVATTDNAFAHEAVEFSANTLSLARVNLIWVYQHRTPVRSIFGGGLGIIKATPGGGEFKTTAFPGLRAGWEYRAGNRVRFGAFFTYDFINTKGFALETDKISVLNKKPIFEFNRWAIEPTVAFYF